MTTKQITDRLIDRALHTDDPGEYARLALRFAYCKSNELATALRDTPVNHLAQTLENIGVD